MTYFTVMPLKILYKSQQYLPQLQPESSGTYLCAIIVKNAHQADGNGFINTAAQCLSRQGKNKWDTLIPACVNDSVKGLI